MNSIRYSVFRALLITLAVFSPMLASAAPILSFSVTQPIQAAIAGETLNFSGVITNRSGVTLEATDLFFNFLGFNPNVISPNQILGSVPFTLPNNTFSPDVDLFSIDIAPGTLAGSYSVQVLLQDVSSNFSDLSDIVINIASPTSMPEPATIALIALGGLAIIARRRRALPASQLTLCNSAASVL